MLLEREELVTQIGWKELDKLCLLLFDCFTFACCRLASWVRRGGGGGGKGRGGEGLVDRNNAMNVVLSNRSRFKERGGGGERETH
jgi:hypothetical protein